MARLSLIKPRLGTADLRTVRPLPKQADAELQSSEHRAWRLQVLKAANWKCQGCGKQGGRGGITLYADHIVERRDGGDLHDVRNGQALCGSCHTKKTARARAKRMSDRHSTGEIE